MNYFEVIKKNYPESGFGIGDTYDSLIWSSENNTPKPTEEHLETLWQEMKDEYELSIVRIERDKLLKESDVYALPDFPHKTTKEAWLVYRQQLRDLPNNWSGTYPQAPE